MKYFGYGAMANQQIFSAVIGREVSGVQAMLLNFHITTQRMEHVPEAARAVLQKVWPDTFRSYTIMPALRGEVLPIPGVLYDITNFERRLIRSWEMNDLGWFATRSVEVVLGNGQIASAITDVMAGMQRTSGEHVPLSVEELPLLNDLTQTLRVAEAHRKQFANA